MAQWERDNFPDQPFAVFLLVGNMEEFARARKAVKQIFEIIRQRLQRDSNEKSHRKIDPLVASLQSNLNDICSELPDFSRPSIIAADYLLDGSVKEILPKLKEKLTAQEYEEQVIGPTHKDEKELLDLLNAAEKRAADRHKLENQNKDGTIPPNRLKIGACEEKLQPKPWGILNYMWSRNNAHCDDVKDAIWGHNQDVTDAAMKGAIHKANEALVKCSSLRTLHKNDYFITWSNSEKE